jgi:hypothetical protein
MGGEDDAVAILIDEPQVRIEEGGRRRYGIHRKRQISGGRVHGGLDARAGEKVPENRSSFSEWPKDRNAEKHGGKAAHVRSSEIIINRLIPCAAGTSPVCHTPGWRTEER